MDAVQSASAEGRNLRDGVRALLSEAKGPLGRGAFFLSLNQVVVSALGFLFWIVVARTYEPAAVGRATSLIAAGVFLAIMATMGLPYALVRRIASSRDPRRLGRSVLLATGGAGLAAGAGGGIAFALLSPQFASALSSPLDVALFAGFVCAFTLEVVLEQVLVAARKSEWSTAMLLVFSALRLAGPFAVPGGGVRELVLFWAASMGLAVAGTLLVLVPRALAALPAAPEGEPPALRPLVSYAALNHAATLLALAGPSLLPAALLMALGGTEGATAAASFYLAFQVASLLFTVSVALALVQFAEGSRPDVDRRANERRALRLGAMVVVPASALLVVLAPLILSFFGALYSDAATPLLRALALAAVAALPATVLATRYRLSGDLRPPILAAGLSSGLALIGALVMVPLVGLVGAGIAILAGQVVAGALLSLAPGRAAKEGGASLV
ncbi:MAG TPA: oligosaccharide flippase family protein [Candidatus Thermoplasmatota archaeon]|nr:oligosaccharide flippase family protein [Candidatus Thermoplasmatota archaeon]